MGRGTGEGVSWDGVMTWFNRLPPVNSRLSGCHVRRRQASSAVLEMDSRLDQLALEVVGDDRRPLLSVENPPAPGELIMPGPKPGLPTLIPCGEWNGLLPEGTLNRRPGVLEPAYMLWDRECDEIGEATPEPHLGLLCSVEKVAEIGVLQSLGEGWR